jgi:hypothetical protein
MKLIGMLLSLVLFNNPPTSIVLIDTELKKPAGQTDDFSFDHYAKKQFPVYSADVKEVAETSEKVARMLEKQNDFTFDTVMANHTAFILNTEEINYYKVVTVRLVTSIEEKSMSFSFELVKQESNTRKMQKKLLDFSDYLSK